ncbi:MAG: Ulp1 family isopeptidase [Pseudomonadota bacterium]
MNRYLQVLRRGHRDLAGDSPATDALGSEQRQTLRGTTQERIAEVLAYYVRDIHPQTIAAAIPATQRVAVWLGVLQLAQEAGAQIAQTQEAVAAIAADFQQVGDKQLQTIPLPDLHQLAVIFDAFKAPQCTEALGSIARHIASINVPDDALTESENQKLQNIFKRLPTLEASYGDSLPVVIKKLNLLIAPGKASKYLEEIRPLSQEQRFAKLDAIIKDELGIAHVFINGALERQLIDGEEAHHWIDRLLSEPQWNDLVDKKYPGRVDASVKVATEQLKELNKKPNISNKNIDACAKAIKDSVVDANAKAKDKRNAENAWKQFTENKTKPLPPVHLSYLKAIRKYYQDSGAEVPKTFSEQTDQALNGVKELKEKTERSARSEASVAYMNDLSPRKKPAVEESKKNDVPAAAAQPAVQPSTTAQPASNTYTAVGKEEATTVTATKNKRKKPQKKKGQDPLSSASLNSDFVPALIDWQEGKDVPATLLILDSSNKYQVAEALLAAPSWDVFLSKKHKTEIEQVSQETARKLSRLDSSLAVNDVPSAERDYYTKNINAIVNSKISSREPGGHWYDAQNRLAQWESLHESFALPMRQHNCFSEIMDYCEHENQTSLGDIEEARQAALAGIKQQEKTLNKKALTLTYLDRVLSARNAQSGEATVQLTPQEVTELFNGMGKQKSRKGQMPISQPLANKLAEMPFAQIQEPVLDTPDADAFFNQKIRGDSSKFTQEREQLQAKLNTLQKVLDENAETNLLSLVRAYYLGRYNHENAPQQQRRKLLRERELDWNNNIKVWLTKNNDGDKQLGQKYFSCLTVIRDHFLNRPNDMRGNIEDVRALAIKETEEQLKTIERNITLYKQKAILDSLLVFLRHTFPQKELPTISDVELPLEKGQALPIVTKSSAVVKQKVKKETKKILPAEFGQQVAEAVRAKNDETANLLVKNALKKNSPNEVLNFLTSNDAWMGFIYEVIGDDRPADAEKLRAYNKKHAELEKQAMNMPIIHMAGVTIDTLLMNKAQQRNLLICLRHEQEMSTFSQKVMREITAQYLPLLRHTESQSVAGNMEEGETHQELPEGFLAQLIIAARANDNSLAIGLIKSAAKQVALDEISNLVSRSPEWKEFTWEMVDVSEGGATAIEKRESYQEQLTILGRTLSGNPVLLSEYLIELRLSIDEEKWKNLEASDAILRDLEVRTKQNNSPEDFDCLMEMRKWFVEQGPSHTAGNDIRALQNQVRQSVESKMAIFERNIESQITTQFFNKWLPSIIEEEGLASFRNQLLQSVEERDGKDVLVILYGIMKDAPEYVGKIAQMLDGEENWNRFVAEKAKDFTEDDVLETEQNDENENLFQSLSNYNQRFFRWTYREGKIFISARAIFEKIVDALSKNKSGDAKRLLVENLAGTSMNYKTKLAEILTGDPAWETFLLKEQGPSFEQKQLKILENVFTQAELTKYSKRMTSFLKLASSDVKSPEWTELFNSKFNQVPIAILGRLKLTAQYYSKASAAYPENLETARKTALAAKSQEIESNPWVPTYRYLHTLSPLVTSQATQPQSSPLTAQEEMLLASILQTMKENKPNKQKQISQMRMLPVWHKYLELKNGPQFKAEADRYRMVDMILAKSFEVNASKKPDYFKTIMSIASATNIRLPEIAEELRRRLPNISESDLLRANSITVDIRQGTITAPADLEAARLLSSAAMKRGLEEWWERHTKKHLLSTVTVEPFQAKKINGTAFTQESIGSLAPNAEVHDEVFNFAYDRLNAEFYPKSYFVKPANVKVMAEAAKTSDDVEALVASAGNAEVIFLPINHNNGHWTLLVCDKRNENAPVYHHFDSLNAGDKSGVAKQYAEKVHSFLNLENQSAIDFRTQRAPQQKEADRGVFTLTMGRHIAEQCSQDDEFNIGDIHENDVPPPAVERYDLAQGIKAMPGDEQPEPWTEIPDEFEFTHTIVASAISLDKELVKFNPPTFNITGPLLYRDDVHGIAFFKSDEVNVEEDAIKLSGAMLDQHLMLEEGHSGSLPYMPIFGVRVTDDDTFKDAKIDDIYKIEVAEIGSIGPVKVTKVGQQFISGDKSISESHPLPVIGGASQPADKNQVVIRALASATGMDEAAIRSVNIPHDKKIDNELLITTFSKIKGEHAEVLEHVEMTGGETSHTVVDPNSGQFDETVFTAGLRKHLRTLLRAPGVTAPPQGKSKDAVILTSLPEPDYCASVTKTNTGELHIHTIAGPQLLDDYLKKSAASGNANQLKNIQLVYVDGRVQQIKKEEKQKVTTNTKKRRKK